VAPLGLHQWTPRKLRHDRRFAIYPLRISAENLRAPQRFRGLVIQLTQLIEIDQLCFAGGRT
jgi:hypothetical protein